MKSHETSNAKTNANKTRFIKALTGTFGYIMPACRQCNIAHSTVYRWMQDDPEFSRKVREAQNVQLDVAEFQLAKLINEGNPQAIMYYLNNKGRDRGWGQQYGKSVKVETATQEGNTIKVEIIDTATQAQGTDETP